MDTNTELRAAWLQLFASTLAARCPSPDGLARDVDRKRQIAEGASWARLIADAGLAEYQRRWSLSESAGSGR